MLLIIAVLAILSAAVLLVSYLKRQNENPVDGSRLRDRPPTNLRPLFAPTEQENLAFEHEKRANVAAETENMRLKDIADREAEINALLSTWRMTPNRQNSIQLLHLVADNGDAGIFSRTAFEIIRVFRDDKLEGLTGADLAALLDSHYRLLPDKSQASGELFWLREEIMNLESRTVQ